MLSFTDHDLHDRTDDVLDAGSRQPVGISRDGRPWLVILPAATYERLRRSDRRVFLTEELTEDEIAAIASAEPSPEAERYNDEV
jgi:prevent-host-death family protein